MINKISANKVRTLLSGMRTLPTKLPGFLIDNAYRGGRGSDNTPFRAYLLYGCPRVECTHTLVAENLLSNRIRNLIEKIPNCYDFRVI